MDRLLRRIWSEDKAEDLVEYVLLIVVVAAVLVAAMSTFEAGVSQVFSEAVSSF